MAESYESLMYYGRANIEIEKHLRSGPMTVRDLQEATGMRLDTIGAALKRMRAANQVFIVDWTRDQPGRLPRPRPLYKLGRYHDKPRPEPYTNAENCARYRNKPCFTSLPL